MEETLDPRSPGGAGPERQQPDRPALVVLFHPDLRRIGDVAFLPASAAPGAAELSLGREIPEFRAPSGHARALLDPCLSRRQLTVRYSPSPARFEVASEPNARRALAFFNLRGRPVEAREGALAPGSLLAIGDRVLLWVGLLPSEALDADLGIVGASVEASKTRREIRALARESSTVLIWGETGTGKEVVARALHACGPNALEPFVAVNCAAIPDALVDSEFFGHARGAFSGASLARDGLFRAAGRGTIFLDEIGELSATAQAKLLRTLQERTVRPLGESREHELAARVVAATHRPLWDDVEAGRFRTDLLARIETPRIDLSPLRERRVDVPILFAHFLERAARASGSAPQIFREPSADAPPLPMSMVLELLQCPWTKNVRELEKFATSAELGYRTSGRWASAPEAGNGPERGAPNERTSGARPARPTATELTKLLDQHEFIAKRAAEDLGVSRTTLDKWMRELGIRRPSDIGLQEIEAACARFCGDMTSVAAALRVSVRGLKLRLQELRLSPP